MGFEAIVVAAAVTLFFGMLLCFEAGRRLGRRRLARDADGVNRGSGPVEAAVFGLLGLLLAFTFSGAADRFEERRHLITEETNNIGTAYLRLDLLPADAQPALRDLFRAYVDARVIVYRDAADEELTQSRLAKSAGLQQQIWTQSVAAAQRADASPTAGKLLLPALNAMIDITTTRAVARQNHPPRVIFYLLAALSLVSSLLVGYVMCSTAVRSWFYMLTFAFTMSFTLFVIFELEYPRYGVIRIDSADQVLVDLRESMQ
jgi:Protein of unknown function (DUF4239)